MPDLICANTSFAEVLSKIGAAQTGDRVLIPAGIVTFTKCISSQAGDENTLLQNKAITIEGGYGGGETVFEDARTQSQLYPHRPMMLYWITVDTGLTCLKKLTINGSLITQYTNGSSVGTVGSIFLSGNSSQVRITQCKLYPQRQPILTVTGYIRGVIDNCEEDEHLHSNGTVAIYIHHPSWGNIGTYGDNSWHVAHTLGTSEAFFIEDCTFTNNLTFGAFRAACDGWLGHRIVVRRNQLHNMIISNHGTESSGRGRSARHWEVYENVITSSVGFSPSTIGSRGGTGVVFNNTMTTPNPGTDGTGVDPRFVTDVVNQRNDPPEIMYVCTWAGKTIPVSVTRAFNGTNWIATVTSPQRFSLTTSYHGFASTDDYVMLTGFTPTIYNGTFRITGFTQTTFSFIIPGGSDPGAVTVLGKFMSPWDGNTDDYGYPCMEQIGSGPGILLSADVPVGQPVSESREPYHVWNNTRNGAVQNLAINGSRSAQVIIENRDYFNRAPQVGDIMYPYSPYTYPHPLNDFSGGGVDTFLAGCGRSSARLYGVFQTRLQVGKFTLRF